MSVSVNNNASSIAMDKPLTLISLFFLMLKGFFKGLPKMILWTIIRAAVSFLAVMILHTYLVVVKNEGFAPDPNNPFYAIMNLSGNKGSVLFWSLAAFILSSLAGRIFFEGPLKVISGFVSVPDFIIKGFKGSGKLSMPVFLSGISASVLFTVFFRNNYIIATIAIGIFLSLTSGKQGMWFLVLSTALSDFKRIFMKNKSINHGSIAVFITGLIIGLVLSFIIPLKPYGSIFIVILCLVLAYLVVKGKASSKVIIWFGGIFAFQAIVLKTTGVFADDGGWMEAGGTLSSWWNSPGAGTAMGMGVPPSLAGLLGALFGGSGTPKPPPIPEIMDYNVKGWKWINENGKWVLYQVDGRGNKLGHGIPQSLFDADPNLLGNMARIYNQPTCGYDGAVDKINESMENFGSGYTSHFTSDGWKNLSEAQRLDAFRALSRQIAEAAGVDPSKITITMNPETEWIDDPSNPGHSIHVYDRYTNGAYNPGNNTININPKSLNFENPAKMIKTLCHEMRHAAQENSNADLGGGKDYRDLITWNNNNSNYQQAGNDFTRYSGQLLERDADAFGRAVQRAIMQNVMRNKYGL